MQEIISPEKIAATVIKVITNKERHSVVAIKSPPTYFVLAGAISVGTAALYAAGKLESHKMQERIKDYLMWTKRLSGPLEN